MTKRSIPRMNQILRENPKFFNDQAFEQVAVSAMTITEISI